MKEGRDPRSEGRGALPESAPEGGGGGSGALIQQTQKHVLLHMGQGPEVRPSLMVETQRIANGPICSLLSESVSDGGSNREKGLSTVRTLGCGQAVE